MGWHELDSSATEQQQVTGSSEHGIFFWLAYDLASPRSLLHWVTYSVAVLKYLFQISGYTLNVRNVFSIIFVSTSYLSLN